MGAVRAVDRVVSAVLAVALLAGGVVIAIEVVLASLDRAHWLLPHEEWARRARETAYDDRSARLVFVALGLLGAALLVLELARRRPPALPVAGRDGGVATDLERRGVERWLTTRLADVDGADGVRATVTHKAVELRAQSPQREVADVQRRLERAAEEELARLDLARPLSARAKVTSRRTS